MVVTPVARGVRKALNEVNGTTLVVFDETVNNFPTLVAEEAAAVSVGPAIDNVLMDAQVNLMARVRSVLDSDEKTGGKIFLATTAIKEAFSGSGNPMLKDMAAGDLIPRTRIRVNRVFKRQGLPYRWVGMKIVVEGSPEAAPQGPAQG